TVPPDMLSERWLWVYAVAVALSVLVVGCADAGAPSARDTSSGDTEGGRTGADDQSGVVENPDAGSCAELEATELGEPGSDAAANGGSDAGIVRDAGGRDSEPSQPVLDDLVVQGVRVSLKPAFSPERTRYSVL